MWQDAGKTSVASADEHDLAAIADAFVPASDWTNQDATFFPKLDDVSGVWAARTTNGSLTRAVEAVTPVTVVMRFKANSQGVYVIAFGTAGNVMAVGFDNSDRLFSYTATGYASAGDLNDLGWHTVSAVIGGAGARLRYDGAQIATGTNAAASPASIRIGSNDSSDSPCLMHRFILASGDIGDTEIAEAEAWVAL